MVRMGQVRDLVGRFWQQLTTRYQLSITVWALAGLLLLSSVPAAWAAPLTAPEPQPTNATTDGSKAAATRPQNDGPTDAGDIPSETVSRFVAAYLAVVELIETKEPNLQRAETDTESRQMQEEIQRQAVAVIQDHDLTLQAYWELLGLANSDPEFRERVLAQVEEASL